jgi:hypothetical protein
MFRVLFLAPKYYRRTGDKKTVTGRRKAGYGTARNCQAVKPFMEPKVRAREGLLKQPHLPL